MQTEFKWTDENVQEFVTDLLRNGFYDIPKHVEDFKVSKQPKRIIFTTEDGIDIEIGSPYWYVTRDFKIYEDICDSHTGATVVAHGNVGDKFFSTKEKAEEYILWNKPLFSLKEIRANSGVPDTNPYFQKIVQIARKKMNNQ